MANVYFLYAWRPVFLHLANLKNVGHSVVIDGYYYNNGNFMIHTNEGEGDQKEGWYDFYKGILLTDDNTYSCPLKMRIFWASDA